MTALNRRTLLGAAGASSLAAVLAACSDTGADGSAVASSTSGADYNKVINSGPLASEDAVSASTWASAIKKAGKLQTGGTKVSLVFSQEDPATGELKGFDAGLAQALARYIIGGDDAASLVEVTQATSDTRETLLENGQVQAVIATYTIKPERAEKVSFAGPYYTSGQAILVRSDNTTINSVEDLAGVTVAVQSSATSGKALEALVPDVVLSYFEDDSKCVAALETKHVEAYVVDYPLLLSHIATNDTFKIVGDTFSEEPYGIGLPKDSDAQAFVNTFLQTIYDDGTWAAIWKATIGEVVDEEVPTPPQIGSVPGSETDGAAASSTRPTDGASAEATGDAGAQPSDGAAAQPTDDGAQPTDDTAPQGDAAGDAADASPQPTE